MHDSWIIYRQVNYILSFDLWAKGFWFNTYWSLLLIHLLHTFAACRIVSVFAFVYFRPEDRSNHCLYCLHRAKPSAASTAATVLLPYACRSLAPRCPQGSPPCSTLWRSAILNSQYLNVIRTSSPSVQELRESCGECVNNLRILLSCFMQGSWVICILHWSSLEVCYNKFYPCE